MGIIGKSERDEEILRNRSKTMELNTEYIIRIQNFHELFCFSRAENEEIQQNLEK
jgi:hypothetical protein